MKLSEALIALSAGDNVRLPRWLPEFYLFTEKWTVGYTAILMNLGDDTEAEHYKFSLEELESKDWRLV